MLWTKPSLRKKLNGTFDRNFHTKTETVKISLRMFWNYIFVFSWLLRCHWNKTDIESAEDVSIEREECEEIDWCWRKCSLSARYVLLNQYIYRFLPFWSLCIHHFPCNYNFDVFILTSIMATMIRIWTKLLKIENTLRKLFRMYIIYF